MMMSTPRTTLVKNAFIFYLRMSQLCKFICSVLLLVFSLFFTTFTNSIQFQKKIQKISYCGWHSPKYIQVSPFTLLFCRGRERNVQRFKTHVHSYFVTFSSPSRFAKTPYSVHLVSRFSKAQKRERGNEVTSWEGGTISKA